MELCLGPWATVRVLGCVEGLAAFLASRSLGQSDASDSFFSCQLEFGHGGEMTHCVSRGLLLYGAVETVLGSITPKLLTLTNHLLNLRLLDRLSHQVHQCLTLFLHRFVQFLGIFFAQPHLCEFTQRLKTQLF